jgi:hypothetical protein
MAYNASGMKKVKTGDKSRLIASPKVVKMDPNKGKAGGVKTGSNKAVAVSAEFEFPGKLT